MLVIVDYGLGNLGSIANMATRLGAEPVVSSDPEILRAAGKLVVPGVGAFDRGMQNLRERGLVDVLSEKALEERVPVLGLCLGMHLFTRGSEEGTERGLGWLEADTVRFRFAGNGASLKVPHMGWSDVIVRRPHYLFRDGDEERRYYFVHSYHVVCSDPDLVVGETTYGHPFASIVARDNIVGVQFHPEKSHQYGMALLRNFIDRAA
ncbi:MAG TPA: imidazole glycerol phosphate synthase subunit HisH [Gaiellaceae bacterium]|nr:imidazole glycerol phosphate synthase subunit HisH [Gaiellaceae bacterium]